MAKKSFFRRKTAEQIMKDKELVRTETPLDLAGQVKRLSENQVLVIATNIMPMK